MDIYELSEELTPAVMSRGIDDYHHLTTIGFILLFQVGYFIFEWGSVRKKNADTVLIKTFVIFVFTCFSTYSFGYAFAYGSTYFIGREYYFTSFNMDDNTTQMNEIKWSLFFVTASLTAQLSSSGLQERALTMVSFVYSIIISLVVFPFVVGWTIGKGFLYKLGLVDFSGCTSIHLVAGFCSLFASIMIKQRLGRYDPLAIKKIQDDKEIYISVIEKQSIQDKINAISQNMQLKREKNLENYVESARKLVKRVGHDNFYSINSQILCFVGSIIMWFTLCQLYSGYALSVYNERYQAEVAYINCLVAGAGGGIFALITKEGWDFKYWKNFKNLKSGYRFKSSHDVNTQIANPATRYDIFVIGRGIIAGCVMISAPGSNYKVWISFMIGCAGGIIQVVSSILLQKFKIDDPMQVFQTHGVPAIVSLILIVVFDSNQGIFFTQAGDIVTETKLQQIIQIFGANVLGFLIVIGWCALFCVIFLVIIKPCCLRVGKEGEIIGLDIDQYIIGNEKAENKIQYITTEYYPENAADYLKKKLRLLQMARRGKKNARKQLTIEELTQIKDLLDNEIKEVFREEAPFIHQLFAQEEEEEKQRILEKLRKKEKPDKSKSMKETMAQTIVTEIEKQPSEAIQGKKRWWQKFNMRNWMRRKKNLQQQEDEKEGQIDNLDDHVEELDKKASLIEKHGSMRGSFKGGSFKEINKLQKQVSSGAQTVSQENRQSYGWLPHEDIYEKKMFVEEHKRSSNEEEMVFSMQHEKEDNTDFYKQNTQRSNNFRLGAFQKNGQIKPDSSQDYSESNEGEISSESHLEDPEDEVNEDSLRHHIEANIVSGIVKNLRKSGGQRLGQVNNFVFNSDSQEEIDRSSLIRKDNSKISSKVESSYRLGAGGNVSQAIGRQGSSMIPDNGPDAQKSKTSKNFRNNNDSSLI